MRAFHLLSRFTVLFALLWMLSGCLDDEDDREVAQDIPSDTNASPTAVGGIDAGVEQAEVAIEDGAFSEDVLSLQVDEPTTLTIENRDDQTYQIQIEGLVNATDLPPGDQTLVQFTTPTSGEFQAELLDANGEVVATMQVHVEEETGAP